MDWAFCSSTIEATSIEDNLVGFYMREKTCTNEKLVMLVTVINFPNMNDSTTTFFIYNVYDEKKKNTMYSNWSRKITLELN